MNYRILRFMLPVLAVLAIATVPAAHAGDIKIIANSSVGASSLQGDELKAVFLGTKTSIADGSHVEPVLEKGGPAHEAFVKQYLGKTDIALQTYYRSMVFTGKGAMPKELSG